MQSINNNNKGTPVKTIKFVLGVLGIVLGFSLILAAVFANSVGTSASMLVSFVAVLSGVAHLGELVYKLPD